MNSRHSKLYIYHAISLGLCFISTLCYWKFLLQLNSSSFSEFYEVAGLSLQEIWLCTGVITAFLIFHSIIVSSIYAVREKPKVNVGLIINLLLILLNVSPFVYPIVNKLKDEYKFSELNNFVEACGNKSIKTVLSIINEMPKDKALDDNVGFCVDRAIYSQRSDLLEFLNEIEGNGFKIVPEKNQGRWQDFVDRLTGKNTFYEKDLNVLKWFNERGVKFNYKIDEDFYFVNSDFCHVDMNYPAARQYFDLLIEMGATVENPNFGLCAREGRSENIKFLISKGVRIRDEQNSDCLTGLYESVVSHNVEIVELLIKAGAKQSQFQERPGIPKILQHCLNRSEIIEACIGLDSEYKSDYIKIIQLLKEANFRIDKNSSYYSNNKLYDDPRITSTEIRQCLKDFE